MDPQTVALQLEFSRMVVKKNVGDVTHEESLRRFEPSPNSVNWILGHVVATRSQFLRALGGDPVWSEETARPYDRHAPPMTDPRQARPLAEMWRDYDISQERLLATVRALTPARLAEKLPPQFAQGPIDTFGSLVAVAGFHDAYHAGQTGLLRRLLGKPPADL